MWASLTTCQDFKFLHMHPSEKLLLSSPRLSPHGHRVLSSSCRNALTGLTGLAFGFATQANLEQQASYVQMLLVDYSSAFSTILPHKLVDRLRDQGLLCFTLIYSVTVSVSAFFGDVRVIYRDTLRGLSFPK